MDTGIKLKHVPQLLRKFLVVETQFFVKYGSSQNQI